MQKQRALSQKSLPNDCLNKGLKKFGCVTSFLILAKHFTLVRRALVFNHQWRNDMGNLANWAGFLTAIIPTLIILKEYKGADVNSLKALVCGILLLVLAIANTALMSNFQTMYEALESSSKIAQDELSTGKYSMSLWAVMFPAIVGALGVNILTSWLQPSGDRQN